MTADEMRAISNGRAQSTNVDPPPAHASYAANPPSVELVEPTVIVATRTITLRSVPVLVTEGPRVEELDERAARRRAAMVEHSETGL